MFQKWNSLNKITKTCLSNISIYTRTGDGGQSGLYSKKRLYKDNKIFELIGTVDELNSFVGAAQEHSLTEKNNLHNDLITIQSRLQDINSHIAFPRKTIIINDQLKEMFEKTKFNPNNIDILEQKIDTYMNHLPPLHNFVLPGGGHCAASLHICRSVCRRVEREMVNFYLNMDVDKAVFRYVNRLSDYFFAAARYATHKNKRIDVIYKPDKNWN